MRKIKTVLTTYVKNTIIFVHSKSKIIFLLINKRQIARCLIILGFLISMANYGLQLFDMYDGENTSMILNMDDSEEKSESKENDSSEKEDKKEKDKIYQENVLGQSGLASLFFSLYPDFCTYNTSVYLEHKTPPPEFS